MIVIKSSESLYVNLSYSFYSFRESPIKLEANANSKFDTWTYKTKLMENIELFAKDHFPDIKRRKEITLALNVCTEISIEQKIGARIVRRSLENNKNTKLFKFNNQVLKGFAITWYKQTVVHYVDFNKTGTFCFFLLSNNLILIHKLLFFKKGPSGVSLLKKLLSNKNLIVNITDAKLSYKIISQCCNIKSVCKFRDPFVADWLINGQQKNSLNNLVICIHCTFIHVSV